MNRWREMAGRGMEDGRYPVRDGANVKNWPINGNAVSQVRSPASGAGWRIPPPPAWGYARPSPIDLIMSVAELPWLFSLRPASGRCIAGRTAGVTLVPMPRFSFWRRERPNVSLLRRSVVFRAEATQREARGPLLGEWPHPCSDMQAIVPRLQRNEQPCVDP